MKAVSSNGILYDGCLLNYQNSTSVNIYYAMKVNFYSLKLLGSEIK